MAHRRWRDPRDQRPVESRHDVLVYTSDILKQPLAIAGPVKMKLHAATDGPDTDFVAKLVDVHPNGFAMNVAEGILRARFRKGLDQMELLKAGQPYEFVIDMAGTANVFLPGHRIRVDITSSHFPQFDRNPNTGEDLGASDKVRIARQTVFHSRRQAQPHPVAGGGTATKRETWGNVEWAAIAVSWRRENVGLLPLGIQRSMVQRIFQLLGALNLRLPYLVATRDEATGGRTNDAVQNLIP